MSSLANLTNPVGTSTPEQVAAQIQASQVEQILDILDTMFTETSLPVVTILNNFVKIQDRLEDHIGTLVKQLHRPC